jgi:hypothetical protein
VGMCTLQGPREQTSVSGVPARELDGVAARTRSSRASGSGGSKPKAQRAARRGTRLDEI